MGLVVALGAAAFFIAGAGAVVSGSPSGFESQDGNMVLNTVDGSATDWNCFVGSDNFQSGTPNTNCAVKTGATQVTADPNGEITWVNGQKFDTECPALQTGNVPNKDDFTNVAEYTEFDNNNSNPTYGDLFFYGASIRAVSNGNASGDVEFNQNKGDGTTTAGCRTWNDRLVAYDFLNGGTNLEFHVLTWITADHPDAGGNSGTCYVKTHSMPCWGAFIITPDSTTFDGESNQSAITAANNGISGTALDAQQFAEFGVDLTKALTGSSGNPLPCFPQQVWESRSSGSSFTSNPEDIEFVYASTCGGIIIRKVTDPSPDVAGTSFGYTTTGGLSPSTFSLKDGENQNYGTDVSAGPYSVTETGEDGYTLTSIDCSASTTNGGSTTSTDTSTGTVTIGLAAGDTIDCTYTNTLNTATLSTASSEKSTVFPGASVNDTATVSDDASAITPTGDVTFYLCGPSETSLSGCSSSDSSRTTVGSPVTLAETVTGTATATSSDVNTSGSPLTPGYYCFEATWPGDSNFLNSLDETDDSANECFQVIKIGTTTTTTPSVGQNGSTTFGDTTVTDTAVVQAMATGDGVPTGTVTFHLCDPSTVDTNGGDCSAGGTQVGSAVTLGAALGDSPPDASATSAAFDNNGDGVNQVGTWCWRADFSPSGANGNNYTGSTDANTTECFTVTDTTTTHSEQVWYPNDSASVSADHGAPISGTLAIELYTGDNCGATSGSAVSGQSYDSGDQTDQTSITVDSGDQISYGVSATADVSWLVTFTSDDTSVIGSSSHCEKSSLTVNNNNP